ncbi:hypothetical protein T10_12397, partial [Trichinella papuae]
LRAASSSLRVRNKNLGDSSPCHTIITCNRLVTNGTPIATGHSRSEPNTSGKVATKDSVLPMPSMICNIEPHMPRYWTGASSLTNIDARPKEPPNEMPNNSRPTMNSSNAFTNLATTVNAEPSEHINPVVIKPPRRPSRSAISLVNNAPTTAPICKAALVNDHSTVISEPTNETP